VIYACLLVIHDNRLFPSLYFIKKENEVNTAYKRLRNLLFFLRVGLLLFYFSFFLSYVILKLAG